MTRIDQWCTLDNKNSEYEYEAEIGDGGFCEIVGLVIEDGESDIDDGENEEAVVEVEDPFEIEPGLSALFYGFFNEFVGLLIVGVMNVLLGIDVTMKDEGLLSIVFGLCGQSHSRMQII